MAHIVLSALADEATSALDAISRVLVHEAIKAWRDNRTTIVITHDLSPIAPNDFVYVMADGRVVQQGYREDLEALGNGRFYDMIHSQEVPPEDGRAHERAEPRWLAPGSPETSSKLSPSVGSSAHRLSTSNLLFPPTAEDVVSAGRQLWSARRISRSGPSSVNGSAPSPAKFTPGVSDSVESRDARVLSLFVPADAPDEPSRQQRLSDMALADLERSGVDAVRARAGGRRQWIHDGSAAGAPPAGVEGMQGSASDDVSMVRMPRRTIPQLARRYWRTIPNKLLLVAGLSFSGIVGACTPIFSMFISRVISNLGNPNAMSLITQSAIVVIALAVVDGVGSFLKFYCMERCAMGWTTALRRTALAKVVRQDKSFFDAPGNTASALSYSIIKDSEDARTLVGTIVSQLAVLVSMLFIGIVWSLATGWELTLVGFGLAPVIIIVSRSLASVLNRLEAENKDKRETISKHLMDVSVDASVNYGSQGRSDASVQSLKVLSNVKAIRSMSIQSVFDSTYERVVESTYAGGIRAAPFAGLGFASTFTLTYLSQGIFLSGRWREKWDL